MHRIFSFFFRITDFFGFKPENLNKKTFSLCKHATVKMIIDPVSGRIIDANEEAAHFYGWSTGQLKQMNIAQISYPGNDSLKQLINTKDREPYHFEQSHRKANGEKVEVELTCIKINIGGGSYFYITIHDVTEKKLTGLALKETAERYRLVLENSMDAILVTKPDGSVLSANKAACEMFDMTEEEICAAGRDGLVDMNDYRLNELIETRNRTGKGYGEVTLKRKNGTRFPAEISSAIFHNSGGEIQSSMIIRDITERRKAEEAIRESETTYRELIDGMNETAWVIGLDGKIMDANKSASETLGYTKEELISTGLWGIDSLLKKDQIMDMVRSMPEKKTIVFETRHRSKNGKEFPVEICSTLVTYKGKKAIFSVARNILQRKRDEEFHNILYEIAHSSTNSKAIEDLLVVVRKELSKVMDTTNFYIALYYPERDILRKVIFVNEKFNIEEWDAKNSLSGEVIRTGKTLLLRKDERESYAETHQISITGIPPECWMGVPVMDEKNPIGVIVVQSYTDPNAYDQNSKRLLEIIAHELAIVFQRKKIIQDLLEAKEKAEESNRLKTAFLANISHEIRTPMNGILGFLDLLRKPNLNEDQKEKYIDIVNKSGQRLLATIDNIVEVAKIESGQLNVILSDINVMDEMRFHFDFFKPLSDAKNIHLKVNEQVTGEKAIIRTDKQKLRGILTNLINNAIKFTHEGEVEFGNYLDNGSIGFYVKDSGIGIPDHQLNHIFDRFVQVDSGLKRRYEGSGLGLSIVKGYIESLKGEIWVESEVGKGSSFFFTVPYEKKKAVPKVTIRFPEPVNSTTDRNFSILIAEDDENSFSFLEALLGEEYIILRTQSGEDTVEMVKMNSGIDLVLMDIKMPGMDGLEATREIRKFNLRIPVIAQTAHAFTGDRMKAIEAGCTDYISKPVKRQLLSDMIRKYIKEKQ